MEKEFNKRWLTGGLEVAGVDLVVADAYTSSSSSGTSILETLSFLCSCTYHRQHQDYYSVIRRDLLGLASWKLETN
jgi:hypothetical protein